LQAGDKALDVGFVMVDSIFCSYCESASLALFLRQIGRPLRDAKQRSFHKPFSWLSKAI
jgi:hypothetical protein